MNKDYNNTKSVLACVKMCKFIVRNLDVTFILFTGEEAMKRLLACKGKDPYRYYSCVILF